MFTIFSVPKPFVPPLDVIQRNAIRSWRRGHPDAQLILFGDEEGTAALAADVQAEHHRSLAQTSFGAPRLDDVFTRAHAAARFPMRCFVNSDVVLLDDHAKALRALEALAGPLLAVGETRDVEIDGALDFDDPSWAGRLRSLALSNGKTRGPFALDYAVYTAGLFHHIPSFAVGRARADNWLVHNALAAGAKVVDLTRSVLASTSATTTSICPADGRTPTAARTPNAISGLPASVATSTCTGCSTRRTSSRRKASASARCGSSSRASWLQRLALAELA